MATEAHPTPLHHPLIPERPVRTRAGAAPPPCGPPGAVRRRAGWVRALVGVVAMALALTLASCGSAPADTNTVRFGLGSSDKTAVYTPVYYADQNGIWQKHDLQVPSQFLSAQAAIAALVNGDIDVAFVGKGILSAIAQAGAGKVIASAGYNGLELWGKAGVTSVDQLRGKTVAASTPGGVVDDAAKGGLIRHGMQPGQDANIVYLQNTTAELTALASGTVDAAVLSPPATVSAKQQGLSYLDNVEKDAAPGVVAVNGDFLESHRDLVQRFVEAFKEASMGAASDHAKAVAAYQAAAPSGDPALAEGSVTRLQASWQVTPYPADAAAEILKENAATADIDPAEVLDNEFVDAVGAFTGVNPS